MGGDGTGDRRGGGRRRRWKTRVTPAFASDVRHQIAWLFSQDREAWAQGLKQALRTARSLLEATPYSANADDSGLRRLLLGRLPFFLWYRVDETGRAVVWLRLFHARQVRARRLKR